MAHVQLHHNHRTTTLPHLGPHIDSRDQFTASVAPFPRRVSDHYSRASSFPVTRRQPLNGYTSPVTRMDSLHYAHRAPSEVPPLMAMEMLGSLQYLDPGLTAIKVEINGTIDKGPFLSQEREWTCYRRNYLACVCSFALSPSYGNFPIQFTPANLSTGNGRQSFQVLGFAMCISAVVADNEQHNIELVQHTPKRDKGPTGKPPKTLLAPRSGSTLHSSMTIYGDNTPLGNGRPIYTDAFGVQPGVSQPIPTEHTFERIQFKQATQNNGKRRAAQQYYHLVVELWADVGSQANEQFIKVAFRKSAKMIVRGRSPGHYQNERRNSHGNGTSGAAGSGGYHRPMAAVGDFTNAPAAIAGTGVSYNSVYDGRSTSYNGVRHQEMSPESIFSSSDDKPSNKAYQYYTTGSTYEGQTERVGVDLFGHRHGTEPLHSNGPNANGRKVKPEFDFNMLPSPFSGGARTEDHHRERFDGRPSSGGFYPSIVSPTGLGAM